MADDDPTLPPLKNKAYSDFTLRIQEWEKINLIKEVLEVC
jgi:hypothetical protein